MTSILLLVWVQTAQAVTWPGDSDWIPIELDGAPLADACGDVAGNDWWDVIGDATNPAAYYYDDGTNLWFRLRLADDPYSSADWREFGWGVMFETDWDVTDEKY